MDFGQSRVAPTTADADVDLDQVVEMVRAGDPFGLKQFHRVFSPGVRFLIERKLGKPAVEKEARAVLETAIQAIRNDPSMESRSLPKLVRRLILERVERQQHLEANDLPATTLAEGVQAAERVIEQMSPLEREALRRCYVLGERPEVIAQQLGFKEKDLRSIRSRARAEFHTAASRQINVA